jgi:hypothetical protein
MESRKLLGNIGNNVPYSFCIGRRYTGDGSTKFRNKNEIFSLSTVAQCTIVVITLTPSAILPTSHGWCVDEILPAGWIYVGALQEVKMFSYIDNK